MHTGTLEASVQCAGSYRAVIEILLADHADHVHAPAVHALVAPPAHHVEDALTDQVAPLFSAKSVDGVRAYELARKLHKEGKTLDKAAQELIRTSRITISELELLEFNEAYDSEGGRDSEGRATNSQESNASSRINITDNSALGLPHASIRMACSKGTYVRAFARDLGEALGSGAHLDSLQRSRSGIFKVEDALSVEQTLEKLAQ